MELVSSPAGTCCWQSCWPGRWIALPRPVRRPGKS